MSLVKSYCKFVLFALKPRQFHCKMRTCLALNMWGKKGNAYAGEVWCVESHGGGHIEHCVVYIYGSYPKITGVSLFWTTL